MNFDLLTAVKFDTLSLASNLKNWEDKIHITLSNYMHNTINWFRDQQIRM